ncbi:ribonucleoside triphosphate reductase, partial [Candidatus Bathyarchaeota archaeon]
MDEDSLRRLDVVRTVDDYLSQADWRSRENSNLSYSFSSVFLHLAGEAMARDTLEKIYPREVAEAHRSGDFHIHNLYMGIIGYCAGWSVADI